MNRLVTACIVGALASLSLGSLACSPVAVGDPCTPEQEFAKNSGAANPDDLTIDVNSVQCETRVCLSLYFQGRITCPYGNGAAISQTGACAQVGEQRGYYTIDGQKGGTLCCPVPGDPAQTPIANPVPAQCSGRGPGDSVYCSCRCDIPDPGSIPGITEEEKNELDKSKVQLCDCPSGYACVPLCDQTHGNCSIVPKGKWGSYCVKDNNKGTGVARAADPSGQASSLCGLGVTPPS
jgi:hypothetical protein